MRNQGRPRYLWLATVTMHCEPAAKSSSLISGACCPAHGSGSIVTVIPEVRILPGILSLHKLDLSLKMRKIDTLDALEEHEEHEDDYQTNSN